MKIILSRKLGKKDCFDIGDWCKNGNCEICITEIARVFAS